MIFPNTPDDPGLGSISDLAKTPKGSVYSLRSRDYELYNSVAMFFLVRFFQSDLSFCIVEEVFNWREVAEHEIGNPSLL